MTFTKFEADSSGRLYGHHHDGSVLPVGLTFPEFASRSDITPDEVDDAIDDRDIARVVEERTSQPDVVYLSLEELAERTGIDLGDLEQRQ